MNMWCLALLILSFSFEIQAGHPLTGLNDHETLIVSVSEIKNVNCDDWCGEADLFIGAAVTYLSYDWLMPHLRIREKENLKRTGNFTLARQNKIHFSEQKKKAMTLELPAKLLHQERFTAYTLEKKSFLELELELMEDDAFFDYFQSEGSSLLGESHFRLKDLTQKIRESETGKIEIEIKDDHNRQYQGWALGRIEERTPTYASAKLVLSIKN